MFASVHDRGPARLLIAATDFPPSNGGIQRLLHELATRLARRWRITVLAPAHGDARQYDRDAPFLVRRTTSDWHGSRKGVLAEMAALASRMPSDLLLAGHLNALPPLFAALPPRRKAVMVYGSELWAQRTRLLTRLLGRSVNRAMVISHFTAREAVAAGIPQSRIVMTPCGAEFEPSTDAPDQLVRLGLVREGKALPFFLTVSRLDEPHKGHDIFLKALPALLERHPGLLYVIAGDGHLADELRAQADALGVRRAVRMLGAVDESTKACLLPACRAFVMVSRESHKPPLFEGFGIAYLEAALAGRPSLAGASGGVPDAVVHEETGLLVDPLSVPAVTAAAMLLLDDPELADAMGERARVRALRDFTWDTAIGRMETCLEGMLK